MAKGTAKKAFFKSLPDDIKQRLGWRFYLPPNVPVAIYRRFDVLKSMHKCGDVRDYITQLAIIGLEEVRAGNIDLVEHYEFRRKVICNSISIDYVIIDHNKLNDFKTYINEDSLRSIKDVISAAIVAGHIAAAHRVVCGPKRAPPIYS